MVAAFLRLAAVTVSFVVRLSLQRCDGSYRWTIRGLWLDDYAAATDHAARSPRDCPVIAMEPLNPGMEHLMHDMWRACPEHGATDEWLWNHELQKHGACIKKFLVPTLDSNNYFESTMQLYYGLDVFIDAACGGKNKQTHAAVTCVLNVTAPLAGAPTLTRLGL